MKNKELYDMKKAKSIPVFALSLSLFLCGCTAPAKPDSTSSDTTVNEQAVTEGTVSETPVTYLGEMRDIDIHELVGEMRTGWNLGNTFDALGGETAWGNPKTTHEMIDTVADAGFNVIRIPVTWGENIDDNDNYRISEQWLDRVNEVVDYAFDNDMYVILNCHHETSWIKPSMSEIDNVLPKYTAMWTQIAEHFEPYGDHLLFESLNEPRIEGGKNEWNGGTADGREAVNVLNKAFVDTVRATGGNNTKRALLITTFAAQIVKSGLDALEMPDDDRIIVSLHAYTPYNYTYNSKESWEVFTFTDSVASEIDKVFDTIDKYFTEKDIPVIITEYGSVSKSEPGETTRNDAENAKWIKYYLERAKRSGIPCVVWDNGYYYSGNELFGQLDRKALKWYVPELIDSIMSVYK